jgi:hypothetical protein
VIDATVATDDWLVERYQRCLLCGKLAAWHDVCVVEQRGYFAGVCREHHSPQGWRAVDQLLWHRYRRK